MDFILRLKEKMEKQQLQIEVLYHIEEINWKLKYGSNNRPNLNSPKSGGGASRKDDNKNENENDDEIKNIYQFFA